MSGAKARQEMTIEEFLAWNLDQDERYELVDGYPVPLRAMSGARAKHDTIVVNLIAELRSQLRDTHCRPRTANTAVRTRINSVRRPDVTIECAPIDPEALEARNPVAAFEVLSPTTRKLDGSVKLQEYLRHPTLRLVVHIDPDFMDVLMYLRGEDGTWDTMRLGKPDEQVRLPGLPVAVALSAVYDGVPLSQGPES